MGQNNCKEQWSGYSSQEYFNRQVEFYRWRADPRFNTHICRDSLRDRENLKSLLEHQFNQTSFISVNDIISLASKNNSHPIQQIMAFENYACTLSALEEKLSLPETLYCLHSLFTGYEVLLSKLGKLKAKLEFCFVTGEGEVRAWFNRDFKSNENIEDEKQEDKTLVPINSEIGLIKRILEFGQRLSCNSTEFLHFSRQFRSFMERDMLQNWTMINARKLINSYVYTYKVALPTNLKDTLKKRQRTIFNATISDHYNSQVSSSTSQNYMPSKTELISTGGEPFYKNNIDSLSASNLTMQRRDAPQRPISLSEHSIKKSAQPSQHSFKTHSKKFSSTDLKHINQGGRQYQSPKMLRSQVASNYSDNQDSKQRRRQVVKLQNSYPEAGQKIRRERQFAIMDEQDKHLNTTQLFSPVQNRLNDSKELKSCNFMTLDVNKQKAKENVSQGILKQNQCAKQKKKLQKKAATVSKYITFYQQTRNLSNVESSVPEISSDIVKEMSEEEKSSQFQFYASQIKKDKKPAVTFIHPKAQKPGQKLCLQKRQISMEQELSLPAYSSPVSRKPSFDGMPTTNSFVLPFKGKTQNLEFGRERRNVGQSHQSTEQFDFTIRTINKLVDNNQVSMHESNGSFMSIAQSQGSQYQGVLTKMGRSVDILNLPSNKHMPVSKKALAISNNLQKAFNYY